jgi:branched-chain amino acid transport system ATP-binding protein
VGLSMKQEAVDRRSATGSNDGAPTGLLVVSDVRVRFGGVLVLDDLSFTVDSGQIVGLIGPNGAGKTTLFNCISRLCACERGAIALAGTNLLRQDRQRIAPLGVGRTFQNPAIFGMMSVLDNVVVGRHCRTRSGFLASAMGLRRVGHEAREAADRARGLLHWLGLDAVADRPAAQLPIALRKRVELGRALASEPRLLLLDEPASGLNHVEVDTLGRLIREIRDALGLTVLLVEHHMGLVMGVSDKVVALNFGRKIAEGAPAQVRRDAAVLGAYLGPQP